MLSTHASAEIVQGAFGLVCPVNYPSLRQQKEVISRHADNVLAVTLLIFAAGIFVGIMSGTGMIKASSVTAHEYNRLSPVCPSLMIA